jgi:hypothetical protein
MDASKTVTRVELYDMVYRKVGLSRRESADLTEFSLNGNLSLHCARRDGQAGGIWYIYST